MSAVNTYKGLDREDIPFFCVYSLCPPRSIECDGTGWVDNDVEVAWYGVANEALVV